MSITNSSFNTPTYSALHSLFNISEVTTIADITKIKCEKLGSYIFSDFHFDFVKQVITTCKAQINKQFSKFKLSALHLAVIKGKIEIAAELLNHGSKINALDHKGFPPLHHAVLNGRPDMIKFLKEMGADVNIVNKHGGRYHHIEKFINLLGYSTSLPKSLNQTAIAQFNPHFNPTCLKPGVTLVKEHVASPQELVNQWEKDLEAIPSPVRKALPFVLKAYRAYKKNPPKLKVDHITHDDAGKKLSLAINPCGVFAQEKIMPGQVISEYIGQIVSELPNDKTYLLDPIDGRYFRNEGPMMNDALPNANIIELPNVNGIEKRFLIIATEEILAGQEITLNYALGDYTKFSSHLELRPKAAEEFFTNAKWPDLASSYQFLFDPISDWQSYIKETNKLGKLLYILDTPTTFLDLINNDVINLAAIDELKKHQSIWSNRRQYYWIWLFHMEKVLQAKNLIDQTSSEFRHHFIAAYQDLFSILQKPFEWETLLAAALSSLVNFVEEFKEIKNSEKIRDVTQQKYLLDHLKAHFVKQAKLLPAQSRQYLALLVEKGNIF